LDAIGCDVRIADVCISDVGDYVKWRLGHRWPTPNSWDRDEGEEETY